MHENRTTGQRHLRLDAATLILAGVGVTHYRGASPPHHAFNNVGFRCAADLPQAAASKGEAS